MTDISFEKFDGLVKAWINGERPDLKDFRFNGWNVEAMVRFINQIRSCSGAYLRRIEKICQ